MQKKSGRDFVTLQDMIKSLGLEKVPECFSQYYEEIRDTWRDRAQQILSEVYIQKTIAGSYALKDYVEIILEAAQQLRQREAMCLLACLLEKWMQQDSVDSQQYQAPAGEGLAYDFLHLFPAIPAMPESIAHLRSRGVPEDVIRDTMGEYDYCVEMCRKSLGRPAFNWGRLVWIRHVTKNRLIRIGRFKYDLPGRYIQGFRAYRNAAGDITVLADGMQVHRSGGILGSVGLEDAEESFTTQIEETETTVTGHPIVKGLVERKRTALDKAQWKLCLSQEDLVPRIHIPPDGSFDRQIIEDSYQRAREIFGRCYPDYPYKAFFCHTWLLSPQLRRLLKPGSNILTFQEKFIPIPCQSGGNVCFSFLFGMTPQIPEDLGTLPENTSLQRAVKKLYLDGGYLYEGEGFFF